jgi:hypothetical protein
LGSLGFADEEIIMIERNLYPRRSKMLGLSLTLRQTSKIGRVKKREREIYEYLALTGRDRDGGREM